MRLTQDQETQVRLISAALREDQRGSLLRLIAAYMNMEGETSDAAFARALAWALSALPA
jgi:hypothetical protein